MVTFSRQAEDTGNKDDGAVLVTFSRQGQIRINGELDAVVNSAAHCRRWVGDDDRLYDRAASTTFSRARPSMYQRSTRCCNK